MLENFQYSLPLHKPLHAGMQIDPHSLIEFFNFSDSATNNGPHTWSPRQLQSLQSFLTFSATKPVTVAAPNYQGKANLIKSTLELFGGHLLKP